MFALGLLSSMSAFAAKTVTCTNFSDDEVLSGTRSNGEQVYTNDGSGGGQDWMAVVYGSMRLPCVDSEGKKYILAMDGVGAGLHFNGFGTAVLTCPTVKKKNFIGQYGAIKVSVGYLVAGGKVAVISNKRLGMCFLAGLDVMTLGASISVNKMEIVEVDYEGSP